MLLTVYGSRYREITRSYDHQDRLTSWRPEDFRDTRGHVMNCDVTWDDATHREESVDCACETAPCPVWDVPQPTFEWDCPDG